MAPIRRQKCRDLHAVAVAQAGAEQQQSRLLRPFFSNGLFFGKSLQVRQSPTWVFQSRTFKDCNAYARFFKGSILFLSSNQQCKSTAGSDKCCNKTQMYEESNDLIYLLLVSCWRQMVVVEWHKVSFKQSHQQNKIDTVMKL